MSQYDPALLYWYGLKAWAYFGLKQYNQAIDWARRAIAINPNYIPWTHVVLIAALALTIVMQKRAGRCSATSRCPPARHSRPSRHGKRSTSLRSPNEQGGDPRFLEMNERTYEGLREAGMPEGEAKTN
jgi:hypothetical protein